MNFEFSFDVAAAGHRGLVRRVNQDVWSYSLDAGVFVVCDGMGGAAGGEIASGLAVEAFLEHMSAAPAEQRDGAGMEQAVAAANRRVQGRASGDRSLTGMGTTLVALAARPGRGLLLAHVGDSRCYRWRGGALTRLTEDHSWIGEQIRLGLLPESAEAESPMRSVITRAVGTQPSVDPDVQLLKAGAGDVYLLCTDGLTRELPDAALAVLLGRGGGLHERNQSLLDAALQAGGRDNVTCMLVEVLKAAASGE